MRFSGALWGITAWFLHAFVGVAAAAASHDCLEGWRAGPVNCTGARLIGVNLDGAYLPDSRFDGAYLAHSSLRGAYVAGSTFDNALLHRVSMEGMLANGASMRFATLVESGLAFSMLDYADLTGSSLAGCTGLDTVSAKGAETTASYGFHRNKVENKLHVPLIPPAVKSALLLLPGARDVAWMAFTTLVLVLGVSGLPLAIRLTRGKAEQNLEPVGEQGEKAQDSQEANAAKSEIKHKVAAKDEPANLQEGPAGKPKPEEDMKENIVPSPCSDQSDFSTAAVVPSLPSLRPMMRRRTTYGGAARNILTECSPNKA